MKTTLNPFENAKRTAQGAGGASPAIIEEMQAEISVLGSQNETQAQDITDIKTALTELAHAKSSTEYKTGKKDADGYDIYERTIYDVQLVNNSTVNVETLSGIRSVELLYGIAHNNALSLNIRPLPFSASSNNDIRLDITENVLKVITYSDWSSYNANITIQYTKTTT